jgi:acyl carrier protein
MLDALPLNPTGKVDRQALPRPSRERSRGDTPFVRPFETVEHQLAQIWEELLGVRPIGIRDNFFELGGDSLLAARMMHRVEQVCGQKVPLATLFAGATIEQLAKALMQQRVEDDDSLLIQVQAGGANRPLFFMHGDFEGGGFYCLNLARGLGEDQPFYALTPHGVDGAPIPPTIEAIAASFIEMIRTVQPKGPYLLGGLCKGGVTAYEMARQLQEQGEQVDLLVMVGSVAWNTNFRFLQRVVSGVGYLLGLGPEERTRRFLVVRDHWIYKGNVLRDDWMYKRTRLKQVATLSFGEQLVWAFRQVTRSARWLARRVLPGRGREISVTRASQDQQDQMATLPRYKHFKSLGYNMPYYRQLGSYIPGRYSGRVVLFWPAEEPVRHPYKPAWRRAEATDPTLGWGRVASDLEIEILPGVTNTSITKDVKILADHMKSCLDKVRANGRSDKS